MATRDGLAQIWYADANGVITGYTPTADNVASAIIDAYNEHFGTNINIWTPETKTLQVGGTVPNWNAYEKIEIPLQYYAVTTVGSNHFAAGYLVEKVWHVYYTQHNTACCIDDTGLIFAELESADVLIKNMLLPKMRNNGIEVESYVQDVVDWNVGETIPNVEQYTFITS